MQNLLAYDPIDATITVGAEVTDTIVAAIQLIGGNGKALTHRASVWAYISDAADGGTISATEHSGAVTHGANGLLITVSITGLDPAPGPRAKTIFKLVSAVNGRIDVSMTHVGALTRRLVVVLPNGRLIVSPAITHA